MQNYIGIGKDNSADNKHTLSLFFYSRYLSIAFYTKRYKFIPKFFFYGKECFKDEQEIGMFSVCWFIGIVF